MMKLLLVVVGCFALLTASAAESSKMGKRHMEGKNAVQKFQKELKAATKKPETSEELTREFFAKNYKAVFAPFYAKDESGAVVMTKKIDEKGKMVQLVDKGTKLTPASPKEVWEFLEPGTTILVRTNLMEPCGFCDGSRYVLYFDEEVKELTAFNDKYHKQHAVKEEEEEQDNVNRDYNDMYGRKNNNKEEKAKRKRERKEQEYAALVESAEAFGWSEVLPEVKKALHAKEEDTLEEMACCWAEIHNDKNARRFRHMCPVCKGKVSMKVPRTRLFEVVK